MNCIASLIKYMLYIFNIVFVACGIMLIVVGSIVLADIASITDYSQATYIQVIPIIVVSLGSVIFIVSFCGCCGAIRENKFCTSIYSILMFILFCLQTALVIYVLVNYNDFLDAMTKLVDDAWGTSAMNSLQLSFNCCGKNGYTDYTSIAEPVPPSCCGYQSDVCGSDIYTTKQGCEQAFNDFWVTNMDIVAYAGIGIAVVEAITFSFACILINNLRHRGGHNF